MKDITRKINESTGEVEYHVQWVDCKYPDGSSVSTLIVVDKKDAEIFEDFLNDQEANIFVHAEGGDVEY